MLASKLSDSAPPAMAVRSIEKDKVVTPGARLYVPVNWIRVGVFDRYWYDAQPDCV